MMLSKYEGLKAYWKRRNTTYKVLGLWKPIILLNLKLRNVELVYSKYIIFS